MKKAYLFSLILILALNLPGQIHWNKYPDNPVMLASPRGLWDEVLISPSTVLYQDSIYKMWYWGGDHAKHIFQIGYATSTDGINWTKDEINNPVLTKGTVGTWNENTVNVPSVLFRDSVYHMWFTGYTREPRTYRMGHATSTNGVDWIRDKENNPVLDGGPAGSWDAMGAADGTVIHDGDEYHMLYVSKKYSGAKQNMGHATSPDGVIWTKDPLNPVLIPEESWENNRIDFPTVVFDGSVFHLWYGAGTSIGWGMGYASSTDGSTWIKDNGNPVFEGTPDTWDTKSIIGWAVIDSAQIKYKMWYGGNDTFADDSDIGYAYSDTRIPYLFFDARPCFGSTDTVLAGIDLDGMIYIVPEGTTPLIDSILTYKLASEDAQAGSEIQVPFEGLSAGQYTIMAASSVGFICTNPYNFEVVENTNPPNLEFENNSVVQGDTLFVESDKDGTMYLVVVGTTPENIFIQNTRIKDSIQVTAGNQVGFPTSELFPKDYLVYTMDACGLFSEAYQVTVEGPVNGIDRTTAGSIKIYPNPAYDLLTIETDISDQYSIEINTMNGQQIFIGEMEGTTKQLDLSSFRKGVYFITIRSRDFVATRKIIKL